MGFQESKDGTVLCRNVSHTWASLNNDLLTSLWITVRIITVGNLILRGHVSMIQWQVRVTASPNMNLKLKALPFGD